VNRKKKGKKGKKVYSKKRSSPEETDKKITYNRARTPPK
jgi:hypothetical protein